MKYPLLLCATIFLISSCSQSKNVESTTLKAQFTTCPQERPQMCTKEYIPVCATRDTGVRCVAAPCPSTERKTFGNACAACADEKVSGYNLGACAAEPVEKSR